MSERWCECPGHESRDFRELTDHYCAHFIPTGWELEYATLLEREEQRTLYITGKCGQCGGFMHTGEDLTGIGTHDSFLRDVCASMLRFRPYAGRDDSGLYLGGVPQRLEWYWRQDQMTMVGRVEQFAALFHEGVDQLIARRWAKEHMPAQGAPRETAEEFFYGVVRLVTTSGFWPNQGTLFICEPDDLCWPWEKAISHPHFKFLAEMECEGHSELTISCYLYDRLAGEADRKLLVGCIRSLRSDLDTYLTMGKLTGALLYYGEAYRKANLHRYVPYKALKLPERQTEKEKNEHGK